MVQKLTEKVFFSPCGMENTLIEGMLSSDPTKNIIIKTEKGPLWTNGDIFVLNDPSFKEYKFKEIYKETGNDTICLLMPNYGINGTLCFKFGTIKDNRTKESVENLLYSVMESTKENTNISPMLLELSGNKFRILKKEKPAIGKKEYILAKESNLEYAQKILEYEDIKCIGFQQSLSHNYLVKQNHEIIILVPYLPLTSDFGTIKKLV